MLNTMIDENYEEKVLDEFSIPHAVFPQDTMEQKKSLAWRVASLSGEEILLASSFAFSYEGFLAGITVLQIEYFAKNAPAPYKKELIAAISKEYKIKNILDIAKMMDDDLSSKSMQNQKRVRSVLQYIQDNQEMFCFN